MHVAICAIFRNEAPYLREWVEFHRLAGVEEFYLYQNRSEDDYMSAIGSYVAAGVVHLIDWPHQSPCQLQAYQDFISQHRGKPWWVAFLDCDEFLFSPCYATIGEALDAIAQPGWGAVGANWMCFGSGGAETQVPGLVTERFTMRPADSFAPNRHIKSIVRMDRVMSTHADPHFFQVEGGVFNENGVELECALSAQPAHAHLRINHYMTKSREEYLRRIARGRADIRAVRSPSEFDWYQAAEIGDRAIWRFLPKLRQRLQEPQAAPRIAVGTEPRVFSSYHDDHRGETVLVCGCGSSLPAIVAPERFTTIGVNDVGRIFDPDYLVVINPRSQFSGDRFRYVEESRAQAIFTQLDLGIAHRNVVRFQLGRRGGTEVNDGDSLPYTRNSPYVALCLALYMGARRIGLIGVDFTDHHFFAPTGRHPLAREINQINREYQALAECCSRLGVEVFNLGAESRITAFPKISPEEFARRSLVPAAAARAVSGGKVFFVNYRFLSCGEVFSDGLHSAAEDLGMQAAAAYWDDPSLEGKIEAFAPDLLFVVHGRKFAQRSKARKQRYRSAVWLLDEPYEVDETSRFAQIFDTVFLNDPSTLHRHKNAHYLPVCYDPALYHYRPGPRPHRAGFIGGGNPVRDAMLTELARRDLLSYIIGGPWKSAELRRVNTSLNIPAEETARYYRETKIVLNVFRTVHHFNREGIPAVSMNPRIYEALACGALVVSERRSEIEQLCPELPVFDQAGEMVSTVEGLLADPRRMEAIRKACIRRLAGHTYAQRLSSAFATATGIEAGDASTRLMAAHIPAAVPAAADVCPAPARTAPAIAGWIVDAACVEGSHDALTLRAYRKDAPGSETGLVSDASYSEVVLSFDVETQPGGTLLAKIRQAEQHNQASNSYHLLIAGANCYLARHDRIFHSFALAENAWHSVAFSCNRGKLRVLINGRVECEASDALLTSGYCFLGVKSGSARVRNPQIAVPEPEQQTEEPVKSEVRRYSLVHDSGIETGTPPVVSIVTTVYDRVDCLDACLRTVAALSLDRFEHIIVADAPPEPVVAQIRSLVEAQHPGGRRLSFALLSARANDLGVTPAATGLALARGKYVCFLSDDNGYRPEHFQRLVTALDEDENLGFAYSGCLYAGRFTLSFAPPARGRIDLGQPLFRRELFERHGVTGLPFKGELWDWQMIEKFLQNGVRWRHFREPTFIFRLAKYPHLIPPRNGAPTQNRGAQRNSLPHKRQELQTVPPIRQAVPRAPAAIPATGPLAFTATPRRNLIYHIWPARGEMWRWNIDQLKQRIDLFNGLRLISIVHDDRTDHPDEVKASLAGHGCEFLVLPNHPSGESNTFPAMLRRVASQDINEVTFYAHAKGVRHEAEVGPTLRRWVEMSYSAGLDDWDQVRAQLELFALTGSFRRRGRFDVHHRLCDWHYHGTFFWLRHARVFAKDCFDVPQIYHGVEAWPGHHFTHAQSGCILFDNVQITALSEDFWKRGEVELKRWEAAQAASACAPEPNRAFAFDGCEQTLIHQPPEEFEWFLSRLATTLSRSVLVIGSRRGEVEWHIARRFQKLGREIQITTVHSSPSTETLACIEYARRRYGRQISVVERRPHARDLAITHADAVFIDERSYLESSRDFLLAQSLNPRMVAICGIADSEFHARTRCGVPRLWAQVRPLHATGELVATDWGGMGIVRMNGRNF